ncbi:MAG TPA: hypothetical protein VFY60_02595 [Pyrinomonadaceae bacterium]|nr:hypothetical protein [Pyrinomonadaceae bacterium]
MPKDNENIPFLGPIEPTEPEGFTAEQMIRCEECLRANPPTRVTCLYCVAPLPLTESAARLRKPVLRQPDKHQRGYNNILLPQDQVVTSEVVTEAAQLLKLTPENVQQVLAANIPVPVARTASREEAELVYMRLQDLGLHCVTLSDDDLDVSLVKRVKSMSFEDESLTIYQAGAGESITIAWANIKLILPWRLFEARFEMNERMTRKPEKEILDTSEFFKDEAVIDFYDTEHSFTWRVNAAAFDFSCLGREKALVVNENIRKLQRLIIERAVNAHVDESYQRVRNLLELAWSMLPETQSSGWRRERPGKLTVGMATTKSNEIQFTRYSRLRHYFDRNQ